MAIAACPKPSWKKSWHIRKWKPAIKKPHWEIKTGAENINGKKKNKNLHPPIGQVHNISVDNEQIFETMDLVGQGNKNYKADLEAPHMTNSFQLRPVIIQKN